ncbi:porin family protein [Mesorhizobium sp. B3-1-3]|uniref:outer membrane protein n=1 Tax=unclassified Mesorhizobium TaxID=325217 RepID=UPI00112C1203|nr:MULTISPECIES: outer membrane protein [unclassified Mesorhizobium]TPI66873.1 porin family protein [Mesorhizobium sp. B3-1-8]TPI71922.1 porin family protein [Mesorhizobium sp. B3-1-3]
MRSILGTFLVLGVAMTGANAADIVQPVASMEVPYSWTGLYVGANAGGAFGKVDGDFIGIPGSADIGNFTGGALVGANYQYGQWVLGIEGDINYLGFKKEFSPGVGGGGLGAEASVDAFGTIRGRVGYAFDRWLPYVTAGVAMGDVKIDEHVFGVARTKFQTGYAVGGGVEYAFSNNWTARAEYLYVDLGKKDFGFDPIDPYNVKMNFSVVRAALAYKF